MADVGARTTAAVVQTLETEAGAGELEGGEALSERLIELLAETARVGDGAIDMRAKPTVIMAVGVNGTGKTTTIGKLAWHLREELGAQRAARRRRHLPRGGERAARRAGRSGRAARSSPGAEGSDPGAVAFEAIAPGAREGVDVVIVDTAGRLHTQDDLMARARARCAG